MPEDAKAVRPDAMICTGRSDYPNQVNNVLCFPYIFRGALDVAATTINEDMKRAAVEAIAQLAREAPSEIAARAYGGEIGTFGAESLIPSPFDPRFDPPHRSGGRQSCDGQRRGEAADRRSRSLWRAAPALRLQVRLHHEALVYAGESGSEAGHFRRWRGRARASGGAGRHRGGHRHTGSGRPAGRHRGALRALRFVPSIGKDLEIINPDDDPRYRDYVATFVERSGRRGITPDAARSLVRTSTTVIAAIAVVRGDADAMICGLEGRFQSKLRLIRDIIGISAGVRDLSAMTLVITPKGNFFLADTHVRVEPNAEEVAENAILCAEHVRRFGIVPKIALVCHSDFGEADTASSIKMRQALALIRSRAPELEVDGEMQGDTALSQLVRERKLPSSRLTGEANLLVMPNLDSANLAYQFSKVLADGLPIGPILIGPARPAHVLTSSVTARGVVNMTALAVVEAQAQAGELKAG